MNSIISLCLFSITPFLSIISPLLPFGIFLFLPYKSLAASMKLITNDLPILCLLLFLLASFLLPGQTQIESYFTANLLISFFVSALLALTCFRTSSKAPFIIFVIFIFCSALIAVYQFFIDPLLLNIYSSLQTSQTQWLKNLDSVTDSVAFIRIQSIFVSPQMFSINLIAFLLALLSPRAKSEIPTFSLYLVSLIVLIAGFLSASKLFLLCSIVIFADATSLLFRKTINRLKLKTHYLMFLPTLIAIILYVTDKKDYVFNRILSFDAVLESERAGRISTWSNLLSDSSLIGSPNQYNNSPESVIVYFLASYGYLLLTLFLLFMLLLFISRYRKLHCKMHRSWYLKCSLVFVIVIISSPAQLSYSSVFMPALLFYPNLFCIKPDHSSNKTTSSEYITALNI